jgi:hypothetical protein
MLPKQLVCYQNKVTVYQTARGHIQWPRSLNIYHRKYNKSHHTKLMWRVSFASIQTQIPKK